jgi:hypothetical protein
MEKRDLGIGAQVVAPGGMAWLPTVRGDQDDGIFIHCVEERRRARLPALRADRRQQTHRLPKCDADAAPRQAQQHAIVGPIPEPCTPFASCLRKRHFGGCLV